MKLIVISGHAGSGKDTVARMLRDQLHEMDEGENKVLITHYADVLKYICKALFGWDGKKDEKGRALLQYVGTDVVRKQNPNFWVDFTADILSFFDDCWDYVIIPDTRFPNELSRLNERGFDVVHLRVERPGFSSSLTKEQQSHPSETALDHIQPDYLIVNDVGLDGLRLKIKTWIAEDLYETK